MKSQKPLKCTDDTMKEMIRDQAFDDLYICLWEKCFPATRKFILRTKGSNQDAEDVFSDAVFVFLFEKLPNPLFQLTGSVCGFVNAIARNIWLKTLTLRGKHPQSSLDQLFFFGEEGELAMLASLFPEETEAVNHCLEELGKSCRMEKIASSPCASPDEEIYPDLRKKPTCLVLHLKFFNDSKDKDIAPIIGYENIRGVSERRRRCLQSLKECLQKNFPGLFNF